MRWARDGATHVHATEDPADYLREVLNAPGGRVTDLEVRRATLEDAYLSLVHHVETGAAGQSGDHVTDLLAAAPAVQAASAHTQEQR